MVLTIKIINDKITLIRCTLIIMIIVIILVTMSKHNHANDISINDI